MAGQAKRERTMAEVEASIALRQKAEQAWSDAWDRARRADERAGRPYNKNVYAERAHVASVKVLGVCQRKQCIAHRRDGEQRGATKAQLAYRAKRFLCAVEFNSLGHVCRRAKGHAGPHYAETATEAR